MKTRLFGMLLTGFALALAVLVAIEAIPMWNSAAKSEADTITMPDLNRSITPPVFRSISEDNGAVMLSGTSEPDSVLTILNMRKRLLQVTSDKDGNWEAEVGVAGLTNMALDVALLTDGDGQIWGDETVLRLPVPANNDALVGREAMILVTAPGGPSRIVQNPFDADPSDGPLSMGPLDYDNSGGVIFSGRSAIPGRVRIYGNGEAIGETQISSAGRWFFIAADIVPAGPFEISAELLTSNGVLSRVTVSLTRMDPDAGPAANPAKPYIEYSNEAWQIKRSLIGGGAQYTAVFNPNPAGAKE